MGLGVAVMRPSEHVWRRAQVAQCCGGGGGSGCGILTSYWTKDSPGQRL